MSGKYNSSFNKAEVSEKSLVFEQIQKCNELFSSFNSAPAVLNEYSERVSTLELRHKAKGIALAVLTLEKMVFRHLVKLKFFESKEIISQRKLAFGQLNIENGFVVGHPYRMFMSDNYDQQFTGLELISVYYASLIDTIFGLPEFADAVKKSINDESNPSEEIEVVEVDD